MTDSKTFEIGGITYATMKLNELMAQLANVNESIKYVKIYKAAENVYTFYYKYKIWYILFDKIELYDGNNELFDTIDTSVLIPLKLPGKEEMDLLRYIRVYTNKIDTKYGDYYKSINVYS